MLLQKKRFPLQGPFLSVTEKLTWDCPFTFSYVQAAILKDFVQKPRCATQRSLLKFKEKNYLKPLNQLLIISCSQSDPLGWLGGFSPLQQSQKSYQPHVSPASAHQRTANWKLQSSNVCLVQAAPNNKNYPQGCHFSQCLHFTCRSVIWSFFLVFQIMKAFRHLRKKIKALLSLTSKILSISA